MSTFVLLGPVHRQPGRANAAADAVGRRVFRALAGQRPRRADPRRRLRRLLHVRLLYCCLCTAPVPLPLVVSCEQIINVCHAALRSLQLALVCSLSRFAGTLHRRARATAPRRPTGLSCAHSPTTTSCWCVLGC